MSKKTPSSSQQSTSPWRAQVLVTNESHKRRMVVDYCQTINRCTYLDAYIVLNLDKMVNAIAQYEFYSTLDLQSAYHQVPLPDKNNPFTAFEATEDMYQFKQIPFRVTR